MTAASTGGTVKATGPVIRICAWCGASLGEAPPWEDQTVSHGICDRCAARVRAGEEPSPQDPLPPGYWLLVVRRDAHPLFWHLRAGLGDVARVAVILDRRIRERRRTVRTVAADRRTAARRHPPRGLEAARLWRLGLLIVNRTAD